MIVNEALIVDTGNTDSTVFYTIFIVDKQKYRSHRFDRYRVCQLSGVNATHSGGFGQGTAAVGRYDTDVFAFGADQPDFGGPNAVVDAGACITHRRGVVGSAGYGIYPWIVDLFYKWARYGRLHADST